MGVGQADAAGTVDFALARYNGDGSLDTSFGTGGLVTTDFGGFFDSARAAVLQPDGKIVAMGFSNSSGTLDFALARYNSDGSLDTSFGLITTDFGSGSSEAFGGTLLSNGSIIAVGFDADDFALACYESGLQPICLVKQEVELLCNQIEAISTSTLISKLCLIEDQVCTIESTLDIIGPLIGVLNMQAQELIGDFQETWTILQVIEDKLCTSESVLNVVSDKLQSNLDTLDFSGVFTAIEAILQKECTVDGKVNTYESLTDAIVDIDFSGVFTVLDVVESKICLIDDLVQTISAGLEDVSDCLGFPIFQSDVGTTGFVVPAPGRYYLAEDITFEPTADFTAAIFVDGIDNVTLDLNDMVLELSVTASTFAGSAIRVDDSNNVRLLNGTVKEWNAPLNIGLIRFDNCTDVLIENVGLFDGIANTSSGISLDDCRNGITRNVVVENMPRQGITVNATNWVVQNCTIFRAPAQNTFFVAGLLSLITNCCFKDLLVESCGYFGIFVDGGNQSFLNCKANNNAQSGFSLRAGVGAGSVPPGMDVKGCISINNGLDGFRMFSTNGSFTQQGNTITHCIAMNNTRDGIRVQREGGAAPDAINNYIAFNDTIENTTNIRESNSAGPNTYLGNFARNSTAVGDPNNTNYTMVDSDITRKFVTIS